MMSVELLPGRSDGSDSWIYPYDPDEQFWSDDFILGRSKSEADNSGVLVEVANYLSNYIEQTMDEVLQRYNPDPLKQSLLAGILDGITLHNDQLIQHWKSRLEVYPSGLAMAVINRYAQIDHFWRWRMWLDRGPNLMMSYASYTQIQQKILHTLLGLNGVYYFGFKWIEEIDSRLKIAPQQLVMRFNKVFEVPPIEGAQILSGVVDETYDLLEQYSQIDVNRLRRIFRYQRPLLDDPHLLIQIMDN
jgi:hypothetical protein